MLINASFSDYNTICDIYVVTFTSNLAIFPALSTLADCRVTSFGSTWRRRVGRCSSVWSLSWAASPRTTSPQSCYGLMTSSTTPSYGQRTVWTSEGGRLAVLWREGDLVVVVFCWLGLCVVKLCDLPLVVAAFKLRGP